MTLELQVMKTLCISILGLIATFNVQSQNFIPLLIDSSYSWGWAIDFEGGDTLIHEYPIGYSYDANDSLIQRRYPTTRSTFSYGVDTVYQLVEHLDSNDTWNTFSRTATAYLDGHVTSKKNRKVRN